MVMQDQFQVLKSLEVGVYAGVVPVFRACAGGSSREPEIL